jgi:hypothetical protein
MQFISTEQGGRQGPVASDHRPNCWFGEYRDGARLYNDVFFYFLKGRDACEHRGTLWVSPGGSCRADAFPVCASHLRTIASRGMTFDVCEGNRVVANATIEEIVDPAAAPGRLPL